MYRDSTFFSSVITTLINLGQSLFTSARAFYSALTSPINNEIIQNIFSLANNASWLDLIVTCLGSAFFTIVIVFFIKKMV